ALKAYYESEAEKIFKPIRSFFVKQNLDAEYISKVGAAAENIVAVANKGKHDFILMGSHGHGSLANLVLGSVANKVLAHCKTPVLLVR
ncbi:MAG: universal stress protein, partial [Inhella sp.]